MTKDEQIAGLKQALLFYANVKNWRIYATEPDWPHTDYTSKIRQDGGDIAGRALRDYGSK